MLRVLNMLGHGLMKAMGIVICTIMDKPSKITDDGRTFKLLWTEIFQSQILSASGDDWAAFLMMYSA